MHVRFQGQFTFHHVSNKTKAVLPDTYGEDVFTFHHVSIKTLNLFILKINDFNSHSTMYLLKLGAFAHGEYAGFTFTFHHVSIKTLLSAKVDVR